MLKTPAMSPDSSSMTMKQAKSSREQRLSSSSNWSPRSGGYAQGRCSSRLEWTMSRKASRSDALSGLIDTPSLCPGAQQRRQLGALAVGVAAERATRGGAGGERERLGEIVERGGRRAAVGGDDLAPPLGDLLVGLAGAQGGVSAEVADADGRVEHRRDPGRAGAQAEVHV